MLTQRSGFSALALYGELEQRERDQVLVQFSNRSCSVLVATDVAARGLDISQLEMVINVDVTPDSEVHIHRIGRTGRADEEGWAISLASMNEMGAVGRIEQLQNAESEWHKVEDLTPASQEPLVPPMVTPSFFSRYTSALLPSRSWHGRLVQTLSLYLPTGCWLYML